MSETGPTPRRLLPIATFALVTFGTALLAVGVTLAVAGGDESTSAASGEASAPPVEPTASDEPSGPVSDAVEPAWVGATAATTGVPEPALAAYAGASIVLTTTHPGCGLGWNTLAALGRVGSAHGASRPLRIATDVWSAHATDGDGDGTPRPESLDDAALTAGTALCSSGDDLTQPHGLGAALSSYGLTAGEARRTARVAAAYAAGGGPGR